MMWGSLYPDRDFARQTNQLGLLYTEVFDYLEDNQWIESITFFPSDDPVIVVEFSWSTALKDAQGLLKEVNEHWHNRFSQIDISY